MDPLIRSILCTGNLVRRYMDRQAEQNGLDCGGPHMRILGCLAHHSGEPLCQRDIEESFGLASSTVSAVLGQLERQELIRRETVAGDARRKRVQLTEKAWEFHHRIESQARQLEDILCREFSPAERGQMLGYLERMMENLGAAAPKDAQPHPESQEDKTQ